MVLSRAAIFEKYHYFILPTAQLFPFDVNMHWPHEIAGQKMETLPRMDERRASEKLFDRLGGFGFGFGLHEPHDRLFQHSIASPAKPLVDILGKTMVQRVYEIAQRAKLLDSVVVATDDERIVKAVEVPSTFHAT